MREFKKIKTFGRYIIDRDLDVKECKGDVVTLSSGTKVRYLFRNV